MAEETIARRKKPNFRRTDWHKFPKLGLGIKKNQKWRAAKGRQNKVRLGIRGKPARPCIGYGQPNEIKNKVMNFDVVRVENVSQLAGINKKTQGALIAKVGLKKRKQIIEEATKIGIKILNRYRKVE